MPVGNGTGPFGLGPMTGRQAGYCAGYSLPGYMNPIPGRGFWPRFAYGGLAAPYGPGPYWRGLAPWGYGVPYVGGLASVGRWTPQPAVRTRLGSWFWPWSGLEVLVSARQFTRLSCVV